MPLEPVGKNRIQIDDEYLTHSEVKRRIKKLQSELNDYKNKHRCVLCGEFKAKKEFYTQRNNKYADESVYICRECLFNIVERMDSNGEYHSPTRESLILGLAYINKPFYTSLYEECCMSADRNPQYGNTNFARLYISKIVTPAYQTKTFADSDILSSKEVIIMDENEFDAEEKAQLYRDINDVVDIVGFDPFKHEAPADKPILYSYLLSMLDTEEDSDRDIYKIQSCIAITKDYLRVEKYNTLINEMMEDAGSLSKNITTIQKLTSTKMDLQNTINRTAKENGLTSSSSRGANKGSQSFTAKLKTMKDLNLRDSQVNGFDLETCKGMQQVLDISHHSILKQLRLEDNDYATMVAEQREMVRKSKMDAELYQELFRILLRENLDLKKLLNHNGISIGENVVDIEEMMNDLKERVAQEFNGDRPISES